MANKFEEEAVTAVEVVTVNRSPVALPNVRFMTVPFVANRFVVVTETAASEVIVPFVETSVSIVPFVAVRSVTKREEPVAFVKVVFWREVFPRTVRMPLTVAEVLKTKSAVDVPPANWIEFVVVLPAFVTVWRFGVVPVGQLVPLAKHTAMPPTKIAEEVTVFALKVLAFKEEPVAFVKLKVAIVPEVEVRVVIEPLMAVRVLMEAMFEVSESPVAEVKPKFEANKFVEVVLVPVAFTHVMFVRLRGAVRMRFAIVAVVALKIVEVDWAKEAFGANKFVIVEELLVRFVTEPFEALKFVTKRLTPVALAKRKFVMVPEEALKVVTPRVSMLAFVAKRFVVVTEVEVTFPRYAFQRWVESPKVKARSAAGRRFELTSPVMAKLVLVPFVIVVFWREVVPVAVRSAVVSPPKNWTVVVVKLPRAVTL